MKSASGDSGLGMVLVAFAIAMGGPIIEPFLSVLGAITSFASVISAESKVIKRISIGLLIFNSVVAIGSLVMAISFNSFSFI